MRDEIAGALRDGLCDYGGAENVATGLQNIAQAITDSFTTGEYSSANNLTEAIILLAHHLGRIADCLEGFTIRGCKETK